MKISHYWKAVVAAGVASCGSLSTAMVDDQISRGEWVAAAIAAAGALGLTWAIPNKGKPAKPISQI